MENLTEVLTDNGIDIAQNEKEKFNKWMRDKVISIHYYKDDEMLNAYERIEQQE